VKLAAAFLIACLGFALTPARANAGPCCMSATAVGTGRLLPWEHVAVGLRSSAAFHVGTWNDEARFRPADARFAETELRTELWGLVAIVPRLSAALAVPAVLTFRSAGDLDDAGGGLGDLRGGARWEAIPVGARRNVPGVALLASLVAPTGRSMSQAETVLGTDVTGRGAWVLGAGTSVEQLVMPWFARLDLGFTLPLPARRPDLDVDQRYGPGVDGALSCGRELSSGLVASLWTRLAWEDDLTLTGRVVAGTSHLDFGVGLALSWRIERWTVQASADSGIFADGLGNNQPGRVSTTLMGRYGR
jgi:hypothetical protein